MSIHYLRFSIILHFAVAGSTIGLKMGKTTRKKVKKKDSRQPEKTTGKIEGNSLNELTHNDFVY